MTFLINICIPLAILSLTATKQIIMSRIALDSDILLYNHSLDSNTNVAATEIQGVRVKYYIPTAIFSRTISAIITAGVLWTVSA